MAHIVCITGGLRGILNASLALVKQLEQAGHRITYASPGDHCGFVTAQGITYLQLEPWVFQSGDLPMNRWQKLRTIRQRQQNAVEALGVQRFVQTMRGLKPDLLLIDMEMNPHIMAAISSQLPVALLCQFLSIWKRPNLPPIHTNIVPGQGWRGHRLGIEWSWLRYSWQKWQAFQRERWRRMGLDRISVLRCYAKQIGYSGRFRFSLTQWLYPYPHPELPILCFNTLALDFPHNPHPSMHYVGPMVFENRQEPQVDPVTDVVLKQVLKRHHGGGRSLIYCACSTFAEVNQSFLGELIKAVSDQPTWDLVLGLGGQLDAHALGPLPANVHAFDWVPQVQVLKQADCALNNGGINSINECLYFGVPMLIYSLKRFDQEGNAVRIQYHGLGLVGDLYQDTVGQIQTHLQTLLTDQRLQRRVNQMGEGLRRDYCQNQAAQVVERLLAADLELQRPLKIMERVA